MDHGKSKCGISEFLKLQTRDRSLVMTAGASMVGEIQAAGKSIFNSEKRQRAQCIRTGRVLTEGGEDAVPQQARECLGKSGPGTWGKSGRERRGDWILRGTDAETFGRTPFGQSFLADLWRIFFIDHPSLQPAPHRAGARHCGTSERVDYQLGDEQWRRGQGWGPDGRATHMGESGRCSLTAKRAGYRLARGTPTGGLRLRGETRRSIYISHPPPHRFRCAALVGMGTWMGIVARSEGSLH